MAVPAFRRRCGRRLWRCGRNLRRNLRLRFGRHAPCRAFLFRRLFLLGGCFLLAYFLRHAPEVEQGELHALRIIGAARLYLRLFFLRLRCCRFGLHCHFMTWLYLRSDNRCGNGFCHRAFPLCRMQAVHFIQLFVQLIQLNIHMFPQILRHLPDAVPVHDFIGWFPVRVCAAYQIRVGNHADAADIPVLETTYRCLFRLHEQLFIIVQLPFLAAVLLQDNQVATHFRTRVVREEVVRQACDSHQIGITHHILAYGRVGRCVQYPLRGDERHDAALTHRVKAFQEEVVVYCLRCGTPCRVLAARELRVEHSHVAERDVRDSKVEIVREWLLYLLESLHPYLLVWMQVSQYFARHQVFLESHDIRVRLVFQHGIHECAHARRRLQYAIGTYAVFMQYIRDSAGYLRRGVESGQHGLLHGIHVPLVLRIVLAVFTHQPVQLHRRGKQFEVRFRPMHGIRQFLCRVQYALQSAETAILPKYGLFLGGCRPPFPVKDECRPYRLDVVPQPLFAVKRHTRRYKGRRLPSAPCRAGRIRATGRSCRPKGHRRRIHYRQAAAAFG